MGCDAALIRIDGDRISPVAFVSLPMSEALRGKILDCCSLEKSNVWLLCSLNVEIGYWFAQAAKIVLAKASVAADDVECIGSHGQTVYHIAEHEAPYIAPTLQIGEPAIIAYETGIPVVSNLRAMDMAAGGCGAPLVPYAEYLLYRTDHPCALQNLGGIDNVTALGANCGLDDVFAFDTGPDNMLINALAKRFYGTDYDDGGAIATTGAVNEALLAEWMAIPYVRAPPPRAANCIAHNLWRRRLPRTPVSVRKTGLPPRQPIPQPRLS
jgi:anhydro-N-acetylmuramic acid kinase